MRRALLAAAVSGAAFASVANAALVIEVVPGTSENVDANLYDVYFLKLSDNASASTAIQAMQLEYRSNQPNQIVGYNDGGFDPLGGALPGTNNSSLNSRLTPFGSFGFIPGGTNITTPDDEPNWADSLSDFMNNISFRTSSAFSTTRTDFMIGAVVAVKGASGTIRGTINPTLDDANNVAVNLLFGPGGGNESPTVALSSGDVTVDVSPAGLEGFGPITVSASDTDGTVVSLVAGSIPAQIADNLSITGGAAGPLEVSASGLTFDDLGTYVIEFTATDDGGATGVGSLTINIVPEPATLGLIAGAGLLALRRRA